MQIVQHEEKRTPEDWRLGCALQARHATVMDGRTPHANYGR
jgi:hypothetical protein